MRSVTALCKVWLIVMTSRHPAWAANILAIFYVPFYSHQTPMLTLSKALAARGHNLTVITPNPSEIPIANHTEIDVSFVYEMMKNGSSGVSFQSQMSMSTFIHRAMTATGQAMESQLKSPQVQHFLSWGKDVKFDLVLYESIWATPYLAMVHILGSPPVVGITTLEASFLWDFTMGCPTHTGYVPAGSPFRDHMTFFERIINTYNFLYYMYYYHWIAYPIRDRMIKELFGEGLPSSYELDHNKSLMIYSSDGILGYQKPLPSNIVQVGPLHILPTKPLPKDLESWVSGAKEGVIYFSSGSHMQGISFPKNARNNLLNVFKQFKSYRVIWKWESDTLFSGKAENIMFKKWIPQQDLLAHGKVKVFISQCGLQSTQEAIHYLTNLICIPVFCDQEQNAHRIVDLGIGIELDFNDLTFETIYGALNEIIQNPKYRENIQSVSARAKDRVLPPVEQAVWWIEYVLRHKGAKHLRPATLDLNWIQYFFIDIALFLICVVGVSLFIIFKLTKTLLRWYLFKQLQTKAKSQ